MISCRRARALLVDHVRGAASEAALLQLDQHLSGCAGCQHERARWETMSALKDWQPASLGAASRERILKQLVETQPRALPARRAPRPILLFAGAAAAAAALLYSWPAAKHPVVASRPKQIAAQPAVQHFAEPGQLRFADSEVGYRAGTVATLTPDARTISLDDGELDVNGRAPGLRVATKRYVFRLTEAHAAFASASVRVFTGQVWVYTLDGQPVATVGAGETWPSGIGAATATATTTATPVISATAALEKARAALAEGDAPLARRHLARALAAATTQHDRAEAELFGAESYLVERKPARAVESYRRVATAYARLPEGEAAAFAAAQVLSESDGSREGFRAYLDRYPEGRFAREARDRLAESASPMQQ